MRTSIPTAKRKTCSPDWKRLRPRVTRRLLAQITGRIVERFKPKRIVLFGSHAYGKPRFDSDVDILVVMKSKDTPAHRSALVSAACRPPHLPMDVIVLTPKEVKTRLAGFDPFLEEVLSKGRLLYEEAR